MTTAAAAASVTDVSDMSWVQTIVLSIVQGLTEFLPVSSSGHLRIISTLFWGQDAGASFTAVVQLGTEAAVLLFFARDIWRIATGWFAGVGEWVTDLRTRHGRRTRRDSLDYRMGWMVIAATIPVGLVGYLAKDLIRDNLRNLWITAVVLILFSLVFILAERAGTHRRSYDGLRMRDAVIMGLAQCLAIIPGVSPSGATV